MQLLIDFGNTRIKWATEDTGVLQFGAGAVYSEALLEELFEHWWGECSTPDSIWCASVAPLACQQRLEHWCRQQWQQPVRFLTAVACQQGVTNAYTEPATLGSDRWAALLGARHLVTGSVAVIDCGSAITVDLLDADGVHQGGYIVPGLWMMQQCLQERTGRITESPALPGQLTPGDSSASCISHGALRSVTALLDRLMRDLPVGHRQLQWLITGGDAPHIQPYLEQACRAVPDLVLQGLVCVAQNND